MTRDDIDFAGAGDRRSGCASAPRGAPGAVPAETLEGAPAEDTPGVPPGDAVLAADLASIRTPPCDFVRAVVMKQVTREVRQPFVRFQSMRFGRRQPWVDV